MMRKMIGFLVLLAGLAWGQPEAILGGILATPKFRCAMIKAARAVYVTHEGETLGDYKVGPITSDSVQLGHGKQSWPFKLKADNEARLLPLTDAARSPSGPDDTVTARLQAIPCKPALRLLARAQDKSIWIDPRVSGTVDLRVENGSLQGLLECLAARLEMQVLERDGITRVVPAAVAAKDFELPAADTLTGQVKFDFNEADLVFVLRILAQEAGRSLVMSADVKGDVTLTTNTALPIKTLLPLVCGGQVMPLQASAQGGFLTVASNLPTFSDDATGPTLSYAAPRDDFKPVAVADVLKQVAQKTNLKLVLPPGFKARAYVVLAEAPVLAACERMLAVSGYKYTVDQGQLVVTAR